MPLNLSDLVLDSEFQSLLPAGSESERVELVANIRSDGRFIDPLIVWLNHGIVVDGQTRFDIWLNELEKSDEIYPEIIEKSFASKDEVKAWMIRHQNGRRNWSTSQRAMMAEALSTLLVGTNQHKDRVVGIPTTLKSAAEEMNVSVDSVKKARQLKDKGSKPLQEAVTNGHVTLNDANQVINLPKSEQAKAVHAVQNGKAKTVTEAAKPKQPQQAEREPGDETNPESDLITRLAAKFSGDAARLHKTAQDLFNAIDAKKLVSHEFANWHKRYETMMRSILTATEPLTKQGTSLVKAWDDTRKQVDG